MNDQQSRAERLERLKAAISKLSPRIRAVLSAAVRDADGERDR